MLNLILLGCLNWQCISNRTAEFHDIDPRLLYAVIQVESSGCKRIYNRRTRDYGCLQINKVHLRGFRDYQRLSDPVYSIPAGATLLKKTKRPCQYNLGVIGARKNPKTCKAYESKLKKFGWRPKGAKHE